MLFLDAEVVSKFIVNKINTIKIDTININSTFFSICNELILANCFIKGSINLHILPSKLNKSKKDNMCSECIISEEIIYPSFSFEKQKELIIKAFNLGKAKKQ